MSLSSDINTISTSLRNIKDAILLKGVTPSGNITTYATAISQISGSINCVPREVKNGVYQQVSESFTFSLPSTATDLGYEVLRYAFVQSAGLTDVDLPSLTAISNSGALSNTFINCTNLTSVDLSSLTTITGDNALSYAFSGCTSLTNIDLSSLTTITGDSALGYAFSGCTSLTNIDLSSLTTITGSSALSNVFSGCTSLTDVDLSSLTTINNRILYQAFKDCTSLSSLSFPSLTSTSFGDYSNQFSNMLLNITGCTVHFPSNLQSVIGSWSSVTSGFGGTNTTVLFDLPATT